MFENYHSSWEKLMKIFNVWKLDRKKNEEIKEWINSSILTPVYGIHPPTDHMCTNFQFCRPHSSQEKSMEMFNVWKLERKKNEEIKGQICSSIHDTDLHLPMVQVWTNFRLCYIGPTILEKSVTKIFIWKHYRITKWQWENHGRTRPHCI